MSPDASIATLQEQVGRGQIGAVGGGGPDPELGVVVQRVPVEKRRESVRPRGIGCLGDGNALGVGSRHPAQLSNEKAVGEFVILGHYIASVVGGAAIGAAQRGPQGAKGVGSRDQRSTLGVNGIP